MLLCYLTNATKFCSFVCYFFHTKILKFFRRSKKFPGSMLPCWCTVLFQALMQGKLQIFFWLPAKKLNIQAWGTYIFNKLHGQGSSGLYQCWLLPILRLSKNMLLNHIALSILYRRNVLSENVNRTFIPRGQGKQL